LPSRATPGTLSFKDREEEVVKKKIGCWRRLGGWAI